MVQHKAVIKTIDYFQFFQNERNQISLMQPFSINFETIRKSIPKFIVCFMFGLSIKCSKASRVFFYCYEFSLVWSVRIQFIFVLIDLYLLFVALFYLLLFLLSVTLQNQKKISQIDAEKKALLAKVSAFCICISLCLFV